MRARNLKPGFFKNEALVELPCECRLLFAGLWCLADREGRLGDRPRRIKMEVFPADSFDVDALLQRLHDSRLIQRYQVGAERYIAIPKFAEHQKPHPRESASIIPAPGTEQNLGATEATPRSCPARLNPSSLNPESPFLNPESPLPASGLGRPQAELWKAFEQVRSEYPSGTYRDNAWIPAERQWRQLLGDGLAEGEILDRVREYRAQQEAIGKIGSQYVMSPAKFFTDNNWRGPFPIPLHLRPRPRLRTAEEVEAEAFARAGVDNAEDYERWEREQRLKEAFA